MQKLSITIKSFSKNHLYDSINKLTLISKRLDVLDNNFVVLPKRRQKVTVERSPHIDKKSREQFEILTYKGQISISLQNALKTSIYLYILKNSLFPGIELQISIRYSHYF